MYPPRRSILDQWIKSNAEPTVEAAVAKIVGLDVRPWLRGGLMRMMPYQIDLK
jgi:hypothetical protein